MPESITYEATSERTFLDVIKGILAQIQNRFSLNTIAVLPKTNQPLTLYVVKLSYQNVAQQFGDQYYIVPRSTVNGEDLSENLTDGFGGLVSEDQSLAPSEMEEASFMKSSDMDMNMPSPAMEQKRHLSPTMSGSPAVIASKPSSPPRTVKERHLIDMEKSALSAGGSPQAPTASSPQFPSSAMPMAPSAPRSAPPPPPGGAPPPSLAFAPPTPAMERRKEERQEERKDMKMDKVKSKKQESNQKKAFDGAAKFAIEEELEESDEDSEPEASTPGTYAKEVGVEYFDVMNPEKYYPLLMTLTNFKQAILSTQENIITGERKVQKLETMEVTVMNPLVKVRPIFPGCAITPSELTTNLDLEKDELTFYITPLVKDDIKGFIEVLDDTGKIIYKFETPAKVDDPKYAKTIATYGIIASILPKVLVFFDINIDASTSVASLLPMIASLFGSISFTTFFAFIGTIIVLIASFTVYFKRKPKSTLRQFKVSDFRLDILETITRTKGKK